MFTNYLKMLYESNLERFELAAVGIARKLSRINGGLTRADFELYFNYEISDAETLPFAAIDIIFFAYQKALS